MGGTVLKRIVRSTCRIYVNMVEAGIDEFILTVENAGINRTPTEC